MARRHRSLHRNSIGYTTDTDLVGMGVSAISDIGHSFSQHPRALPSWQIAFDEGRLPVFRGMRLSADDILRADPIQQLMCQGEISIGSLERRHAIEFSAYFADDIERSPPWRKTAWCARNPGASWRSGKAG